MCSLFFHVVLAFYNLCVIFWVFHGFSFKNESGLETGTFEVPPDQEITFESQRQSRTAGLPLLVYREIRKPRESGTRQFFFSCIWRISRLKFGK